MQVCDAQEISDSSASGTERDSSPEQQTRAAPLEQSRSDQTAVNLERTKSTANLLERWFVASLESECLESGDWRSKLQHLERRTGNQFTLE
jgi:hypothetical protein